MKFSLKWVKKIFQVFLGSVLFFLFSDSVYCKESLPSFEFDSLGRTEAIKLSDYLGQVILIVNTASRCGFTRQYRGLQSLYESYKERGFVIIGIPCNDFGGQEPGSSSDIQKFCSTKYKITFPLTRKYSILGEDAHPFFLWVKKKIGKSFLPKWNFYKYLIDKEGCFVDSFSSLTSPNSKRFTKAIENLLVSKN